jgi:outer membrane receptor for ferrienterochelin and colicins
MDGAFDHTGGRRLGFWSLTAAALLFALTSNLVAQETEAPPADEGELAELMEVIEQETEVATKTRMNSDFVPGIVTVLRGEELEALGITTAGEALGLVPGMQALRDGSGNHAVIVRGLDFPFNSGNIQILINSIPLTRQDAGINSAALQIPVEQIDRIEVIRGPGSVVYGDFAFMGLVNVITKDAGSRLFARGETPHPTITAGARFAAPAGATTRYSLDLSRRKSDNAIAANTVQDADEETWFGIGQVAMGGFSFTAQAADREYVPPTGTPFDEKSWVAEASYKHDFGAKIHSTASVTYLDNEISGASSQFFGSMSRLSVDVIAETFKNQSWLFAADFSRSEIDEAYHRPPPPPGRPPGPLVLLVSDAEREIFGFTAQDRIDVTPNISVTLGTSTRASRHARQSYGGPATNTSSRRSTPKGIARRPSSSSMPLRPPERRHVIPSK